MSATETRIRLLETALDLIWQSSYNSVGVNEICKQAGVTKGGFYHHFESKAALFCEATTFYWERMKRELDSLFSPACSPLEQLENMIEFILATKLGNDKNNIPGCAFFSAGAQTGTTDSQVREALQSMSRTAVQYNLALVRSLQGDGYLQGDVDVEQTARFIHQFIQGVLTYGRVHCDLETVKKDLPKGIYLLLGLKPEYWFSQEPTWRPDSQPSQRSATG